jgi:hypothetical protein
VLLWCCNYSTKFFIWKKKKIISYRNMFVLFVSNVLLILLTYASILLSRICKYSLDILWKTHTAQRSVFATLKTLFIQNSYKPRTVSKTVLGILIMCTRKYCQYGHRINISSLTLISLWHCAGYR